MPKGMNSAQRDPIWITRMRVTKAQSTIKRLEHQLAQAISYKNECLHELEQQLETSQNNKH